MIIGVLKEPSPETRVSLLPEHISILKKWKVDVIVEDNAGASAFAQNEKYTDAGALIAAREEVIAKATILLSIKLYAGRKV